MDAPSAVIIVGNEFPSGKTINLNTLGENSSNEY